MSPRINSETVKPIPMNTDNLLRIADLIQGHARKLEHLATWKEVFKRSPYSKQEGENIDVVSLLRFFQASKCARMQTDADFFIICTLAEDYAEIVFDTDQELTRLSAKLRVIELNQGLAEFDEFDPDHPETPAEWKALNEKSNRRYREVEKISDGRLVSWLRRHGEIEMAELYLNDRTAFDGRRESGRILIHGTSPDKKASNQPGDPGLTQVEQGDE